MDSDQRIRARRRRSGWSAARIVGALGLAIVAIGAIPTAGATGSWTFVPSPNPPNPQDIYLSGVTCPSLTVCVAVGTQDRVGLPPRTLVMRRNGGPWTIEASPNASLLPDNGLGAVTCRGADNCVAVGWNGAGANDAHTLIERWNGTRWVLQTTPNVRGADLNLLRGISCPTATRCWAVGYWVGPDHMRPLVLRGDGSTWSIVPVPAMPDASALLDVRCPVAGTCFAVGARFVDHQLRTFAARFDGVTWRPVSTPYRPGVDQELRSISCPTAAWCLAVGVAFNGGEGQHTLALRRNSTGWALLPSPNAPGSDVSQLNGISCPAVDDCMAVGAAIGATGWQPLAARRRAGAWSTATPPVATGAVDAGLSGVACRPGPICAAVGGRSDGDIWRSYITRYG